jgi:hypothetical protein
MSYLFFLTTCANVYICKSNYAVTSFASHNPSPVIGTKKKKKHCHQFKSQASLYDLLAVIYFKFLSWYPQNW